MHVDSKWIEQRHKQRLIYKISYRCEECDEDLDFCDDEDQDDLTPEAYCKICFFRCGSCKYYFERVNLKIERVGNLKHKWCKWCHEVKTIPDIKEPETE